MPETIPNHLKEGLVSAAAQEEAIRRDYQIREMAWRCDIPENSLANPTVHHYVSVLRDLRAAVDRDNVDNEDVTPQEGSPRDGRLLTVRGLYSAAQQLLMSGLGRGDVDIAEFRHTLRRMANRFGGSVDYVWPPTDRVPTPPAPGLWSGKL